MDNIKKQTKTTTLKVTLDFGKVDGFSDFMLIFDYLFPKNRKKALYIIDAYNYYTKIEGQRPYILDEEYLSACMFQAIQKEYNIRNKTDLKGFLENEEIYEEFKQNSPKRKKPAKIMIGFASWKKEHVEIFHKLRDMKANVRLENVKKWILTYVADGCDPEAIDFLKRIEVLKLMEYYRETPDKKFLISNVFIQMKAAESIVLPRRYEIQKNGEDKAFSENQLLKMLNRENDVETLLER